mgnify:CR=1 FL=1
MLRKTIYLLVAASLIFGAGCSSLNKKQKGAIIGGASGGVIGGVIGKKAGNTALGAILGAAVGGAAGAYIGNYMDKQAEEMRRDLDGAKIERVGEGIKITFDSGILFDVNKAELKSVSQENLSNLATILNKYEDTNILLEGHTDSQGGEDYNQKLSEQRAASVMKHLAGEGVINGRVSTTGYGETQPVADNETAAGRQQNRRVEVAIWANEKLKKAAKSQTGD